MAGGTESPTIDATSHSHDETGYSDADREFGHTRLSHDFDSNDVDSQPHQGEQGTQYSSVRSHPRLESDDVSTDQVRKGEEVQDQSLLATPRPPPRRFKMRRTSSPTSRSSTTPSTPPVSYVTRKQKRNVVSSATGGDDSETAAYREEEQRLHSHMCPRAVTLTAQLAASEVRWGTLARKQLHAVNIRAAQGEFGEIVHGEPEIGKPAQAMDDHPSNSGRFDPGSPRDGTEMQELDGDSSFNIDITVSTDFDGLTRTPRDCTNLDDCTVHSDLAATETICELDEEDPDSPRTVDCRICGGGEEMGSLVEACECKGSVALVHAHCLKRWIKERPDVKEALATRETYKRLICCEICKRPYKADYGRLAKKAAKARLARVRRLQQSQQERGRRRLDAMAMILRALAIICGAGTVIAAPFLFFQCHKMGSKGCAKLKGQPILLGIVAVVCVALLLAACRRLAAECSSSFRRRRLARRADHRDVHPINVQAPPPAAQAQTQPDQV